MTPSSDALELAPLSIPSEAADLLFRAARTTNAFDDIPVSDEEIHAAYDLMRWGPTAMNTSPLRYLIVRSPEARTRLVTHMAPGNDQKTLTAPLTLVIAADVDFHEQMPLLAPHLGEIAQGLGSSEDARFDLARTGAFLQAGYFIPALRAVGLSVGPMSGFDNAGVDAEFFGGTNWRSILVVNVGHPAAEGAHYPRAPRLSPAEASQTL